MNQETIQYQHIHMLNNAKAERNSSFLKERRKLTSALPLTTLTFDNPVKLTACSKKTQRLFIDSKSVTFQPDHIKFSRYKKIKTSPTNK